MAFKIEVIDQSIVIVDTGSSDVLLDVPKSLVYFDNEELLDGKIDIIPVDDITSIIKALGSLPEITLVNAVDTNDVQFTENSFRSFARQNLGFKTAPGGSGASVQDTPFGPSWNGNTTNAASKNSIYNMVIASKHVQLLGNGVDSTFAIPHNFGVTTYLWRLKNLTDGNDVDIQPEDVDVNNATITTPFVPTTNQLQLILTVL